MKKPSILESSNYVHDLEKYCHSIEQDKIDLETEIKELLDDLSKLYKKYINTVTEHKCVYYNGRCIICMDTEK
jgi:hypothetical protein